MTLVSGNAFDSICWLVLRDFFSPLCHELF
jgi:hypothetical protein